MKGKISHDYLEDDLGHIYLILIDQNANFNQFKIFNGIHRGYEIKQELHEHSK